MQPTIALSVFVSSASFFLAFAAPRAAAQGETGFLRGQGRTDVALTWNYEEFDQIWIGSKKTRRADFGTVTRETESLWIAHGLIDEVDLTATLNYVRAKSTGTPHTRTETDIQDASLGIKWRVFEQRLGPGSFSFLAAPSIKTPVKQYEKDSVTAIGDGQTDLRARVVAHYRFDCGAFVAVESGFDYRTRGTPNEVPLNITAGARFFDRLDVAPFYSLIKVRGHEDIGQVPLPEVAEEWQRIGIGVSLRLSEQLWLTGGWKTTLDGENTGDVDGYWAGLVFRF